MAGLTIPQMIANTANAGGVPPSLAVNVALNESSFNPSAVSRKGAQGLFQLMPGTAAKLGVTNPFDPVQSAQGGVAYLSQLYAQFGSWDAALAAYNWGPENLQNAMATANQTGVPWLSLTPAATQSYVSKVLAGAGLAPTASSIAAAAGITMPPAPVIPAPTDQATQDLINAGVLPDISQTSVATVGTSIFVLVLIGLGVYFGTQLLFSDS